MLFRSDDIEQLTLATAPGRNEYEGVLAALAGSDRKAALALVTDLMSIAGTTNVGGRTVAEIADRVAVMHEGSVSGVLEREQFSEYNVLKLAVGQAFETVETAAP